MKISDIKLVCIQDDQFNGWTVYSEQISGLIVQVENLDDAPAEMAKSFEVMLKYGFDKNIHTILKQ